MASPAQQGPIPHDDPQSQGLLEASDSDAAQGQGLQLEPLNRRTSRPKDDPQSQEALGASDHDSARFLSITTPALLNGYCKRSWKWLLFGAVMLVLVAITGLLVGYFGLHDQSIQEFCPSPYTKVGDECIWSSYPTTLPWIEAKAYCEGKNGSLATPRNVTDFHNYLLQESPYKRYRDYWLGATDMDHEGVWHSYLDGSPIIQADWFRGEPNNGDNNNQDCLYISPWWWTLGGTLFDGNCSWSIYFVCQYYHLG